MFRKVFTQLFLEERYLMMNNKISSFLESLTFLDGGPYHVETSPLISSSNQCTGLYMIGTSAMP